MRHVRHPKLDSHYVFKYMCNARANPNNTYSGRYTHHIAKYTPNKRHITYTTRDNIQNKNSKYDTYTIQNWTHIIYVNGYVMYEQLQTVHIVRSTHISSPIQVKVRSPQEQPSAGAPAAQAPYVLTRRIILQYQNTHIIYSRIKTVHTIRRTHTHHTSSVSSYIVHAHVRSHNKRQTDRIIVCDGGCDGVMVYFFTKKTVGPAS